ncbi:hypothetical protein D3C76_1321800 [compost metagenome]
MVGIVIEDDHLHATGEQQTASNLTEATKPGNDHPRLFFVYFIRLALLSAVGRFQAGQHHQQQRRHRHRERHRQRQRLSPLRIEHVRHAGRAKHHKRKLTPLPQQHRKPAALFPGHLQRTGHQPEHHHLNHQEAHQQNGDAQRMGY